MRAVADMELIKVACPVCHSSDPVVVDTRDGMTNVQCRRCGLVYINPRASEADYRAFYAKGFTQEFNQAAATQARDLAAQAQAKSERIVKFLGAEIKPGLSALDIGCGYGNVLAILRDKYGIEVSGVEPDPIGPAVAKQVFGLEIYPCTLEEYLEKYNAGKKFDLIILHQVLEHLIDIDAAARSIRKLMRPGGLVYVGTPNASWPGCERKSFYRFPHPINPTPYTLALFLWRHGLKTVKVGDLHKPLAFLATDIGDRREMVAWPALLKTSWPLSRLARRREMAFGWHWIRGRRKQATRRLPQPLKQAVKSLLKLVKT